MIITRTPLRVSLVGGGTDMPSFYRRHDGAVISAAIDKYVYIAVKHKFDGTFRVSYSVTENVGTADEIRHDITREAMKIFGFKGLEIVSMADVPGSGTGLGSSSAFAVGLIRAAYAMIGERVSAQTIAEQAFQLESVVCGHPVGKQDHYATACGGFAHYAFRTGGVSRAEFGLSEEQLHEIDGMLALYWTGLSRDANVILQEQSKALASQDGPFAAGLLMTEVVAGLKADLENGEFKHIGRCVNAGWKLKKSFAKAVTSEELDAMVRDARREGADGAKICGAGGGGFLLVVAHPSLQEKIEERLPLKRMPIRISHTGSQVVYREE